VVQELQIGGTSGAGGRRPLPGFDEIDRMMNLTSVLGFIFRPVLALKDYPVLLKYGNIYFVTAGVIAAVAAMTSLLCATYYYKTMFPLQSAGTYFMWQVAIVHLSSLFFSKIFHYFALGTDFLRNPKRHLAETAFYDQGGQVGVFVGTIWFAFNTKINFFACMDINLTAGCLALALGRLGCYSYGCCHGRPTASRFSTIYTNPDSKALRIFPELANVPLAPTQLISAAFSFALFGTMVWALTLSPIAGMVSAYSIIVYSSFRIYLEQYRISVINPSIKLGRKNFFKGVAVTIALCGVLYVIFMLWQPKFYLVIVSPLTLTQFFAVDVFQYRSIVLLLLVALIYVATWGVHYKKLGQHFEWKFEN